MTTTKSTPQCQNIAEPGSTIPVGGKYSVLRAHPQGLAGGFFFERRFRIFRMRALWDSFRVPLEGRERKIRVMDDYVECFEAVPYAAESSRWGVRVARCCGDSCLAEPLNY